jgi:hypothetical protein
VHEGLVVPEVDNLAVDPLFHGVLDIDILSQVVLHSLGLWLHETKII